MFYASLPRPPRKGSRWYTGYGKVDGSEQQRLAYVELMGKEPPVPRSASMRLQYEFGYGQCRTRKMRDAILEGARVQTDQQVLVAA